MPGIGPRRSEIISGRRAGVCVAAGDGWGLKGFRYSPLGLRDGMLAQMLAGTRTCARFVCIATMEAERWEGVLEVCRRYGIDPKKD